MLRAKDGGSSYPITEFLASITFRPMDENGGCFFPFLIGNERKVKLHTLELCRMA